MSRHRNVRNMIEEDYYDYDEYDDYDDDYVAPPKKPASAGKSKGKPQTPAPTKQTTKKPAGPAGKTADKSDSEAASNQQRSLSKTAPEAEAAAAAVITSATVTTSRAAISPLRSSETASATTATTFMSSNASLSSSATNSLKIPDVLLRERIAATTPGSNSRVPFTCVILGHVDAGKSTITGQLLVSTRSDGISSAGTSGRISLSSNHRNSAPTNIAWLLDEDEKEREHGITMDVHVKQFATATRYNMVLQDAPGHADYVPAMITGTATADGALLVVDATDFHTAFDAGQLKEHAVLARGLGVPQIVVVINKMDLLGWSEESYESIVHQLKQFLVQTLSFSANKIRFVPASGMTGENVVNLPPPPECQAWYGENSPTLFQALDEFDVPAPGKLLEKPLRILLTDVAGGEGPQQGSRNGVSVRGKVVQGWVRTGESNLVVLPVGDETSLQKLSSLHTNDFREANQAGKTERDNGRQEYAAAGETIDFVVTGIDVTRLSVGNCLARATARPPLAKLCRAKIWVLASVSLPIIRGAQAIFHSHHLDIPCYFSDLVCTLKKDGSILRQRPRALTSNTQAIVEITLSHSIVMEPFQDCRALGRFVLRRGGDSIAVGRIETVTVQS